MNTEKPFTDPDFDYYSLIKFMGVSQETFCKLVPRYKEPDRTMDYINSLRAEYAAKIGALRLLHERVTSLMCGLYGGCFQLCLQILRHLAI